MLELAGAVAHPTARLDFALPLGSSLRIDAYLRRASSRSRSRSIRRWISWLTLPSLRSPSTAARSALIRSRRTRRSASAARPARPGPSRRRSPPCTGGSARGRGRAGAAAAPRRSASRPRARRAGRAPTARPPAARSPPPATTRARPGRRSARISGGSVSPWPSSVIRITMNVRKMTLARPSDPPRSRARPPADRPRMPHQPTTIHSLSERPGRERQRREHDPHGDHSAASGSPVASSVPAVPSPTSSTTVQLQPEQDEQQRLQPETMIFQNALAVRRCRRRSSRTRASREQAAIAAARMPNAPTSSAASK